MNTRYKAGMKLYSYFRSSAAYRVRIALNLKGVPYETVGIDLRSGAHRASGYTARNPQARVPALELGDGTVIVQSPAILEYLEQTVRDPPLLPKDAVAAAKVRALCAVIACDIHPLNNMSVLNSLKNDLHADEVAVAKWYAYWVSQGFAAIEQMIRPTSYAFGETVTMADVYLVPQVYNARRFNVPIDAFPKILSAASAAEKLETFSNAHPSRQPDADAA